MNIDDVSSTKIEIPQNPITAIFEMQKKLMLKYDKIEKLNGFIVPEVPYNLDNIMVQARIKDLFWRTTEELAEALEAKPLTSFLISWKELWETDVCIRHFFEELADALHFLTEASIIAGLDPEANVAPFFDYNNSIDDDMLNSISIVKLMANIIFNMGIAANILKNKPWKQTQICTDTYKFANKLISTWNSFATLWRKLNCSKEEVYILYTKKHTVNTWRQNTNY